MTLELRRRAPEEPGDDREGRPDDDDPGRQRQEGLGQGEDRHADRQEDHHLQAEDQRAARHLDAIGRFLKAISPRATTTARPVHAPTTAPTR